MMKRVMLMSGVAIVGVVTNHTMGWAYTAMFWWTDVYRDVTVPNYDQVGSLAYYVLLILRQLPVFAVPAFLFASGFYLAFALRGHLRLDLRVVTKRVLRLVIPYLIWSSAIVGWRCLEGQPQSASGLLARLMSTGVYMGYFYVPLLVQAYFAVLVTSFLMQRRPWALLCLAAALQWGAMGIWYLSLARPAPALVSLTQLTPPWTAIRFLFYPVLGYVTYVRQTDVKRFLRRWQWCLLVATVVLLLCSIAEPEILDREYGVDWRGTALTVSASLYATAFIFWFMSIADLPALLSRQLQKLAGESFGIYLLHGPIVEICARATRRWMPCVLAQPLAFMALVFATGLAGSLLVIESVKRTPLRRVYFVLFG